MYFLPQEGLEADEDKLVDLSRSYKVLKVSESRLGVNTDGKDKLSISTFEESYHDRTEDLSPTIGVPKLVDCGILFYQK